MNLLYVANFLKGSNGGLHDRDFLGSIEYLFDGNGLCAPSINDIFIVLDWDKDTHVIKDIPILFDKCVDSIAYSGFQMGQVEIIFSTGHHCWTSYKRRQTRDPPHPMTGVDA
jgi:hypothetical protein